MGMYLRECPSCNKELTYKNKKSYYSANCKNSDCRSCSILNLNRKGKLSRDVPKIGDIFTYWTVLDDTIHEIKKGSWGIMCRCKCGKESYVRVTALLTEKSKGCPCRALDKNRESRVYVGDISETFWSRIKKSATIRKIDFNITKEYCWELFLKQNKKCALSKLDIVIEKSLCRKKGQSNITASLDRIDSKQGYVEGNIQWLHKDVNYIKQDLNEEYFKKLCKLISEHE